MPEVVTFVGFRPPARYDTLPWTQARIEESDVESGTYTALETVDLVPLDLDPAHPAARSFTTELGTAPDYWYRIVFLDATGDVSQATVPLQNSPGTATPAVSAYATTAELARLLNLNPARVTAEQTVALQRCLDAAALEIDSEVGLDAPYAVPPALAVEVNLERAIEHWSQAEAPFGIVGAGGAVPIIVGTDSWKRHGDKLQPLKQSWGLA